MTLQAEAAVVGDRRAWESAGLSAPPATPEGKEWDWRLGFLMYDVSRLRRNVFNEYVRPLGLTGAQWWVLAQLYGSDGMMQSELANMLELGKASVGRLIDRLEESGFVCRIADDTDRRVKQVVLSRKGKQVIAQMQLKSQEMSALVVDGMAPSQRQMLVDLLGQVKTNLQRVKVGSAAGDDETAGD